VPRALRSYHTVIGEDGRMCKQLPANVGKSSGSRRPGYACYRPPMPEALRDPDRAPRHDGVASLVA